ncbi:hypothetical protein B0H11DRAFT_2281719, partial [Mycena galericulata]
MDLLDLDSILPFDTRSMDGADVSIQNAAFDGYPAVGFDLPRRPQVTVTHTTIINPQTTRFPPPNSIISTPLGLQPPILVWISSAKIMSRIWTGIPHW